MNEMTKDTVTPSSPFVEYLANEWNDVSGAEKFSDVTLIHRKGQWKAHKFILGTVSRFFNDACKENDTITLEGISKPEALSLLQFIYKGYYDLPLQNNAKVHLLLHVSMYCIGEKYGIDTLQVEAHEKFGQVCKNTRKRDPYTLIRGLCAAVKRSEEQVQEKEYLRKMQFISVRAFLRSSMESYRWPMRKLLRKNPEFAAQYHELYPDSR